MERLEELIRLLSDPATVSRYAQAKASKTCKCCGQPATCFRNRVAEIEYRISAICQNCQDTYFNPCKGLPH